MEIADWLRGLGLEKYAPAFDENLDRVIAALTIPRNAAVQKIEAIVPAHRESIVNNRKSLMG